MNTKKGSSSLSVNRSKATAAQKKLHRLGNNLSAMDLRLGMLASDPAVPRAQKQNLQALAKLLEDAIKETSELEAFAWQAKA